jgi:DNA-binding beta-propeller fold protein YncE
MTTRSVFVALALLGASACRPGDGTSDPDTNEPAAQARRIVAAIEEEGAVAVLSEEDASVLGVVSLNVGDQMYDVHNVQADPDGRTAWVTAMPIDDSGMSMLDDELVGVDTVDLAITSRIPLGPMLHVAHVVTDGAMAWVSAKDTDEVVEVDLAAGEVMRRIALPEGTGPHGLRRTPDGSRLVVAGMDGAVMAVIDLATGEVTSYDVGGIAVQAAVLPDGSAAYVTLYDTKQVAKLDLGHHEIEIFDLPEGSAGPVQVYPTPDGTGLWVADQGYLNGDAPGNSLYLLDANSGAVRLTADVSPAPHGVVVTEDGSRVWATTLVDGTVEQIDASTGERLSSTPVGEGPNGITCFHDGGAMP